MPRARIKLALSVPSALQSPQSGPVDLVVPTQLIVGEANTTKLKVAVDGLVDKTISWQVNGIPGGNAVFGRISVEGTYTPPAVVPENPNIRIKAIPAAAPSFATDIAVRLIPSPDIALPATSAATPGSTFASPQAVILTCRDVCSSIYFTIDGSEPTLASISYSSPIEVSSPTVLKFFAGF